VYAPKIGEVFLTVITGDRGQGTGDRGQGTGDRGQGIKITVTQLPLFLLSDSMTPAPCYKLS